MQNNLPSINLAGNKQTPFFDRFMNWALTVGRFIIILTEVVAVLAFAYRFSLDEKLDELHSAIKQKQKIVSLLKKDEDTYRNLQERISLTSTFSEKSIKTNKIIRNILNLIPADVKANDLALDQNKINISANVNSVTSLTNFINSLKSYPGIKAINIDNIESKPSIGLSVNITAIFK